MKKDNLLRCIAIFCIAILALLSAPEVKAQIDILDLNEQNRPGNCTADTLLITVNINNDEIDTIVIIENISGFKAISGVVDTDQKYLFAADVGSMCSASTAGEFRIRFESPSGTKIGVNRLDFYIERNSSINYTVTSYQGETGTDYSKTESFPFVFEDCSTEFDSIIISADNANLTVETLFILDNLFIYREPTLVVSSNSPICENENLNLTENGGSAVDWSWSGPDSFTSSAQNPTISSATVAASGTYYVTGTDGDGCENTSSVDVTVNQPTDPTFDPVDAICSGDALAALPTTSNNGITGTWLPALDNTATTEYTFTPTAGQCANSTTLTITVNQPTDPTFDPVDAICSGDALAALPTTSNNGITGTWLPALDNTATTEYTFTPTAGQCANSTTLTITVNQPTDPTFDPVDAICSGDALAALPTTSNNGITGTWLPALDNTATTEYTFTPTAGQCANSTTLTITVNQPTDPTFDPVDAICSGDALAALPTTSNNGITGTWLPALDNTATTEYTFTPTAGQCANSTTLTITVNQPTDPTFDPVDAICSGDALAALPTTSNNGITGSWSPALNNTATTEYTFTPTAGQCANSTTLTITVNQPTDPTFDPVDAICSGDALVALPTTSNNGITGTWLPALDNTATTEYTFTPTVGQCANNAILTIIVNEIPKIVCVMDLSYSMNRDFEDHTTSDPNKQKLPMAKNALEGFVDLLYNHVGDGFCPNLGLSRFPDSPQVGCDANSIKTIQILNNILYSELTNDPTGVIPNLIADGSSTPLLEGINTAINMFNPADNLKMIVLLSDGRHNCPSGNIDDSDIETISTKLNDQGIKLYTIGFGLNTLVPNDLLNQLATKHYNITSITDKPPENPEDEPVDPSYIPGSSTAWDAATALAATYANILQEGLPDIALSLDPLDIINHSKVKQIVVPVSRFDRKVCFYISWVTPQVNQLLVKLFTPDGTELPLNHAGIIVTRRKSHTIISISNEILSQEGMIGNWKLEIDGSGIKTSAERYQYTVFTSSKKLLLNTWFDKNTYYTGDEMKIYLELLVDNRPLTPLDNIFVKASGPGQGLGSWLVSKNVTREQLEKMKQSQFEAFIKYEKEKPEFNELNRAQKQKAEEALRKKFMGNIDPIHLRAQVLLKEFNMKYPHRLLFEDLEFNDKGKDGDEKPGDGLYTAVYKPLTKEGNYQFFFTVIDTSKEKNIKRESQLQKFVNVKIKPERFIKDIMRIDTVLKGVMVYNITLNLRDKYGNIPSPDALRKIKLSMDKGELIDNIQANPDGTFTQLVSLRENVKPRQVKMTMNVYDQVGEQRLESRIPRLIYIIIISVILIITGVYKRNKNRQRII